MTSLITPELSLVFHPSVSSTKAPRRSRRTAARKEKTAPTVAEIPAAPEPVLHLSAILENFGTRRDDERISFRELFHSFGTSSFGISLAVASIPEALPIPVPGSTEVVVIPSLLISSQMIRGHDELSLPRWLLNKTISAKLLKRLSKVALPILRKLEKLSKPSGKWVNTKWARRWIGVLVMALSLIIALPIPAANLVPAIAIFIMGVGMIEHDQRMVMAGIFLGLLSIALIGGATLAVTAALMGA